MVLTSAETVRLIRDGEKGGRGYGGGGRGRLYTYRYTVTTRRTSALRWAEIESHFNVSVGSDEQDSVHKTLSTNHNFSEEKRRAEAVSNRGPSLTSLTPYR